MDLIYGKTLTGFGLPVWRKKYDAAASETAGSQVMKLLADKVIQPLTGIIRDHSSGSKGFCLLFRQASLLPFFAAWVTAIVIL